MWECDYAREPINYRLFFLKLLKKIWIIPLAAMIGAIVIGGIYYVAKIVVGDGYQYRAKTVYYVKYSVNSSGEEVDYYNYYTWNELVKTDYFIDGMYESMNGALSKEYLLENITATIESDYRYLYTMSVSGDMQQAIEMEHKLAELMVSYIDSHDEFESIEIIDKADENCIEDISLTFIGHATIVGAVIGFVASILLMIFYECVDTSIYLPSTLEKRYHIPTLGAASMKEFEENCRHLIGGKKTALLSVDDYKLDPKIFPEGSDVTLCDNPIENAEKGDVIREIDCVVISVKAAAHNGKRIERLLEQLSRQDIKVTAFMLVGEDKWLINKYYR